MTYEYSVALDEKYGGGTALFLERLSRTIEPWSIEELGTLRSAARMGARVYEQVYWQTRPKHRPS